MATKIKHKRSSVQGNVPTTGQLELGELALNTYDGKVYMKKDDGTEAIVEVGAGAGGGATAWGDITGTLSSQTDLQSALDGKASTSHTHEGTTIDATGVTDGYVLTADGAGNAAWEAVAGGGASALDDLTDVVITTPATDEILKFNGTNWVNATNTGGSGIANVVEDTTPQLGGDLDLNGYALFDATRTSGTKALEIDNNITLNSPTTTAEMLSNPVVNIKMPNFSTNTALMARLFGLETLWNGTVTDYSVGNPKVYFRAGQITDNAGYGNTNTQGNQFSISLFGGTYSTGSGYQQVGTNDVFHIDQGTWSGTDEVFLKSRARIKYPLQSQPGNFLGYPVSNGATVFTAGDIISAPLIVPIANFAADAGSNISTLEMLADATWTSLFEAIASYGQYWKIEFIGQIGSFHDNATITVSSAIPQSALNPFIDTAPSWINTSTRTLTMTRPASGFNRYHIIVEGWAQSSGPASVVVTFRGYEN